VRTFAGEQGNGYKTIFLILLCSLPLFGVEQHHHRRNPPMINVQVNHYRQLTANGETDQCGNYAALMAAVPDGSTLYWPVGTDGACYHFDETSCPSGVVFLKHLNYIGGGSGRFNKDTNALAGAACIDTTIDQNNFGGIIAHIAVDCRHSTLVECTGFASGGTVGTAPPSTYLDLLYIGSSRNYLTNPAHGFLVQSGPGNSLSNLRAYYAFHCVAVRSSDTVIDSPYCWDGVDFITKSAAGSGAVNNVRWINVVSEGDAGLAAGWFVTSEDTGVSTSNATLQGLTVNHAAYPTVVKVDRGGVLRNIVIDGVTATNTGTCFYAYEGDANPANAMSGISISDSSFTTVASNCLQNSTNMVDVEYRAVSWYDVGGLPIMGDFFEGRDRWR
jgi:hypothetical protein